MNKVTHFEIVAIDIERAKKFYGDIFGWKFEKWEKSEIEYWMVLTVPPNTPGAINGGLRKEMGTDVKEMTRSVNGFVCTIEVEDIDSILEKVEPAGGKILMPKMHMESLGQFAACLDCEGNAFNLMQMDA